MKRTLLPLTVIFLSVILGFYIHHLNEQKQTSNPKQKPGDWFYLQRAFPNEDVNHEVYQSAIKEALETRKANQTLGAKAGWEFAGAR